MKEFEGKNCIIIDGESLTIKEVVAVARYGKKVEIASIGKKNMETSRDMVEEIIEEGKTVYGITTGFGKFSNVRIDPEQTSELQENLIISHAVGVGKNLPEEVVRAMLLLRANALVKGYSGIRPQVVEMLIEMLNKAVHPVIPEKGSLGASGDLVPLAHMVLVMIGRGEAYYQGVRMPGKKAMERAGIPTIHLQAKEGLALINGTQAMTAIGTLAYYDAECLMKTADIVASMTAEALEVIMAPYDHKVQAVRPHQGQINAAANMRNLLAGSEIVANATHGRVQDAYSLRCIPQIHGASRDALAYVKKAIETEINAVTDNPILFREEGKVISGGNFHGQPMALAFDFLGIAVSEFANEAERRIERLVNPALSGGLPAFLSANGGLNSGFMICQYCAAALVSENKILASPASVDSIPSSANQEDHVSMGTIAARKAQSIVENTRNVLAIELLCAAQGIDMRGGKPALGSGAAYQAVRKEIAYADQDREFRLDISKAQQLIKDETILEAVYQAIGPLN